MTEHRPNIVVILADDMGFSDLGCFGGEIATPNLNRLATAGTRMTHFYNSPRCSPSRASLLTGLHPHQVGVGILNFDDSPDGYPGNLSENSVTIAEAVGTAGYSTYMSGKWHLASEMDKPNDAWPTRRGFDRFFGTLEGAGSFFQPRTLTRDETNVEVEARQEGWFYTDAISAEAAGFIDQHQAETPDRPYFLYLAYTAPHWPLHALADDVERYHGRFDDGWDHLRRQRLERLVADGLLPEDWPLSDRDERVPAWEQIDDREWEARRMEVYAAQIDQMDQGIGTVLDAIERTSGLADTLILFLSDNGGCAEEMPPESVEEFVTSFVPIRMETREGEQVVPGNAPGLMPGPESTYQSYGRGWANLSNTPFREFKHWVHEGGISTPFIAHWPAGLPGGHIVHQPAQLVDLLPTLLDAAGATYPRERSGRAVPPAEGRSLLAAWRGEELAEVPLFWEHEGNAAVRMGRWKLVRKHGQDWELYDMVTDRTELTDLAEKDPELAQELAAEYEAWAQRCGVIPRDVVLDLYQRRGRGLPPE